jgi:hypothetical protein
VSVQAVTVEPVSTSANELCGASVYPLDVASTVLMPEIHFDSVTSYLLALSTFAKRSS